jgi:hypothetical protein
MVTVPILAPTAALLLLVFLAVLLRSAWISDDNYAGGHLLLDGMPATDAELLKRVAIGDGVVRQ